MRTGRFVLNEDGLKLSPSIVINGATIICEVAFPWDVLLKMKDPETEITRIVEGVIHRTILFYTPED